MNYTLPPKMRKMRRTLAASHNLRVVALMLLLCAFVVAGLLFFKSGLAMIGWLLVAGVVEIALIFYIIRASKRQCVALGFVCPLCGGALYDGRSNRLGYRGECPCCKKFIMDKLSEHA